MKKTFICLITGPSGSGKSSVSRALAEKFERSAVIEVDTLRHIIKGGYARPWPRSEEADTQLLLAVENACDIGDNLLAKNFAVFIEDVVREKFLQKYSDYFKDNNFKAFLILPSVESLLTRFDNRGDDKELRLRTIELHKKFLEKRDTLNWTVIDSSNQTLEETVGEIYTALVSL